MAVAAAVRVGRSRACHRVDRPTGETLELARIERRVGGDDDHARAVGRRHLVADFASLRRQLAPNGHTAHREASTEVRLHEHAHGPGVRLHQHASRRCADTAFPAERDRAGPGADRAFGDRSRLRRANGRD